MVSVCDTLLNRNVLNEGVFNMRNYFLYLKTSDNSINNHILEDIFCFGGCKLLAMDVQKYNNKNIRFKLQQELGIRPYYITQSVFKEFLFFAMQNNKLLLMDIRFKDPDVEISLEYDQLLSYIVQRNYNSIYGLIQEIMDNYDTDIAFIVLRYNGYDFKITSDGILDTNAPMEIFVDFIKDKTINKLIIGLY